MRENYPVSIKSRGRGDARGAINVTWYEHSGRVPSPSTRPSSQSLSFRGPSPLLATFAQPGEYVIRVRADNFGRVETSPGNQCCWTNGYNKVAVAP